MLDVENLESGYGKVMILQDVNLKIKKGEMVSVIGRNGVGKSTLIKTIIGLNKVNKGRIIYSEQEITKKKPYERAWKGIGYVPQGHMIFPRLTVKENLMMGEKINYKKDVKPNYEMIYSYFPRLYERRNQLGGTMSGGEQAMLSIGRVLTGNLELMLLDEPSEGVQPNIVRQIGEIVKKINKDLGITILLVEQHLGLIQQISQRGYAMDKGTIVKSLNNEEMQNYNELQKYLSV